MKIFIHYTNKTNGKITERVANRVDAIWAINVPRKLTL